jgi:WhiB family redox-sensing transcriptional regulator
MARCVEVDPEIFFPERGGSSKAARAVCSECSVRQECLLYALTNREQFGIWGGTSERERRRLRRMAPSRNNVALAR